MTTPPVLLILELHGPDAGLSRPLSSIGRIVVTGSRTESHIPRKVRRARLHASPLSDSARCHCRKNSIQTP
jgi:hypothetical protein